MKNRKITIERCVPGSEIANARLDILSEYFLQMERDIKKEPIDEEEYIYNNIFCIRLECYDKRESEILDTKEDF